MTTEQQQDTVEGWCIVEMMGHAVIAGYVTVKRFGGTAFFHVVAEAPEPEEIVLDEWRWIAADYLGPGSRIRIHRDRLEKFVGAGSIYAITPCTEAAARAKQPQRIEVLERVEPRQLAGVPQDEVGLDGDDEDPED